jgi:hypothetical protein
MKLRLTRKYRRSLSEGDGARSAKIKIRLHKVSEKSFKKSLKVVPVKRGDSGTSLNVSGNRRGLHNRLVPPSSEQMKKVRAMRQFYNKQMPVLQCNNCQFSNVCPQFKAGYECAFLPFLNSQRINTERDLLDAMKTVTGANMRRAHVMTLMETLSGAAPSLETSEALNLTFMQLAKLHEVMGEQDEDTLEIDADDSIIGRLFGGLHNLVDQTQKVRQAPIEVPVVVSSVPSEQPQDAVLNTLMGDEVRTDLISEFDREGLETETGQSPVVSVGALR